jgi:hypothetical protein
LRDLLACHRDLLVHAIPQEWDQPLGPLTTVVGGLGDVAHVLLHDGANGAHVGSWILRIHPLPKSDIFVCQCHRGPLILKEPD